MYGGSGSVPCRPRGENIPPGILTKPESAPPPLPSPAASVRHSTQNQTSHSRQYKIRKVLEKTWHKFLDISWCRVTLCSNVTWHKFLDISWCRITLYSNVTWHKFLDISWCRVTLCSNVYNWVKVEFQVVQEISQNFLRIHSLE